MPRYLVSVDAQCAISISTIILTRGSVDESYMTCRTFSNFFHLIMYIPVFPTHNILTQRKSSLIDPSIYLLRGVDDDV